MTSTVKNEAAWIKSASQYPLVIEEGQLPKAGPGEIVIKNAAVSINPIDWKIQAYGFYFSKYPHILGTDVAGHVEMVGSGVTRLAKGDRVIAHCHGLHTKNPANGGFQNYTVATDALISPIPDSLSFEQAVVLPLALSTACAGLYPKHLLNLPLPSVIKPEKTGKTILIWGGASSVGATAIQLATFSGVRVVTTASAANHSFVKSLGADAVFDYKSSTVIEDVTHALTGTDFAGVYDAVSMDSSFDAVASILDNLGHKQPVATVLPGNKNIERYNAEYVLAFATIQEPHQYIGVWIWKTFIFQALANGSFQAKPDPLVAGHGVRDIQKALDLQREGVSAKKVVVTF
ncbi:chaperonin 10-like protein [Truncatella angustata]|uniref:Chaperonin 10-like protein n=1 Tax=Truncatella angustata TaxID=152316 RepID=A0A9P9A0B6_9PEZI|nr:chaperonin 10-like protein [Truncatella angustata]KAH6655945.1 chaperonin 10-like protein [Truncatella angustata]KAH8200956.1 hypothetical protein TruAng_004894 [Truncatella angustata]